MFVGRVSSAVRGVPNDPLVVGAPTVVEVDTEPVLPPRCALATIGPEGTFWFGPFCVAFVLLELDAE